MDGVSGYWVLKAPLVVVGLVLTGLFVLVFILAYAVEFAHDVRYFRTKPAIRNRWRRRAIEICSAGGPTRR